MTENDFPFELVAKPGRTVMHFTDEARRAVVYAQVLARQQGFDYIDVSHLQDAAERVIAGHSMSMDISGTGHVPFSVDAKKALEQSLRVALAAEAEEITPEHLLQAATP